jgi:pyruvate formate lyase activating enzyme
VPSTALAAIHRVADIGRASGLKYVYSGNVPGDRGEKTFCTHCGQLLIDRCGYAVETHLQGAQCTRCGTALEGQF